MFQQLIKIRRLLRTLRDHLLKLGEKKMMIYFKAASIKYLSHENTVEDALIKDLINPSNFNLMVGKLGDVLIKALDAPLGYAINWGRIWSLWPVHLETACCSVEFGAASGPRYDVERFGIIEAFGSLRQCDLVVVQGTVTRKMAPRLRMVYDQMPDPKYVIAMGACAITGGLYIDSYNVLPGVDGNIDRESALADMIRYHEAGFTTWDLADIYGPAEDFIGEFRNRLSKLKGIKELDNIQSFTKWVPQPNRITQSMVQSSIESSLRRMHVSSLDLLQFHWWDYNNPYYMDA